MDIWIALDEANAEKMVEAMTSFGFAPGAVDGVPIRMINLDDLRTNKIASGRLKDLDDVENLPETWTDS